MAQSFCLKLQAIERACEYTEAPVAALCRFIAKALIKIKELIKRRSSHNVHDPLIVFRTFLYETVWSFLAEFMRKITAADQDCTPLELLCSLLNHLSETIML